MLPKWFNRFYAFPTFLDGVTSRTSLCEPMLGYTPLLELPSTATDSGLQTQWCLSATSVVFDVVVLDWYKPLKILNIYC